MNALRVEKKRLEELVAEMKIGLQKKADDHDSVEAVKEAQAQKVELEVKLASLSAELASYRRSASIDNDTELTALRHEKHRLDMLVTHLEDEIQRHKDSVHEQRIRALDLKHELREVSSCCFLYFLHYSCTLLHGTMCYLLGVFCDGFGLCLTDIFFQILLRLRQVP